MHFYFMFLIICKLAFLPLFSEFRRFFRFFAFSAVFHSFFTDLRRFIQDFHCFFNIIIISLFLLTFERLKSLFCDRCFNRILGRFFSFRARSLKLYFVVFLCRFFSFGFLSNFCHRFNALFATVYLPESCESSASFLFSLTRFGGG